MQQQQIGFGPVFPLLALLAVTVLFQIAIVAPATRSGPGWGWMTRASNSSNSSNSSSCSSKSPTLASGQTWVSNPNCTNGTTFNTNNGTTHCHCWSHCGYICGPRNTTTGNSTTGNTTTTTTAASTCKHQPELQSGQTFVNSAGCTNGTTFNESNGNHCHCWSFCGYICGPTPLSTTTAATTTAAAG